MNTPVRSSKCASCPFSLASTQSSGGRDVGMGRDARATDVSDWPWLRRRRPRCMCCELLVLPLTCCACNQIEWLLALSALWNSGAAGGGACSVVVGLHSLTPLQCAPPAAHGLCQHGLGLHQHLACLASIQQAVLAHWPCRMVVQQEVVLAMLWLGSIPWLLARALASFCWLLARAARQAADQGACNRATTQAARCAHTAARCPASACR